MKNFGGGFFLILIFSFSLFFVGEDCLAVSAGEIVINEVAWMGGMNSANDEWLELKNLTGVEIDLSGWTLEAVDGAPKISLSGKISANGYFLLERTSDDNVAGVTADLIYAGALGNSGEVLELKDGAGNLIDKIDASGGWPAGDVEFRFPMERLFDGSWQTSVIVGGTPRTANSDERTLEAPIVEVQPEQVQGDSYAAPSSGSGGGTNNSSVLGMVLINEFSSSPNSGESEWIELYNPNGKELSLNGWKIADGSGTETILSGGFSEDSYYYFIVEKPKGALNNSGDEIVLYDNNHSLVDKIAYGKFGEDSGDNAPAPGKGQSTALKIDGRKGSNDKDGFAISTVPTKGELNVVSALENGSAAADETASSPGSSDVLITEILPNPIGSDREGEFIELYNLSDKEVDLTGWRIEIEGGKIFEFGKFFNFNRVLKAGEYFALYRSVSALVLDNNKGKIRLFAPGKSKASQLLEYGAATEGLSFSDTENINLKNISSSTKNYLQNSLMVNRWVWNEEPTPGSPNQIKTANHAPKISFSVSDKIVTGVPAVFDASDSFDEDGDNLLFVWDFGDGVPIGLETPEHIFYKPGNFKIKLIVDDGKESSALEKILKISGIDLSLKGNSSTNENAIILQKESLEKKNIQSAISGLKTISSIDSSSSIVRAAVVSKAIKQAVPQKVVKNLKIGDVWKILGTVVVTPGIFGVQYFYVITATGTPAVKVYSYYKDFPVLAFGDQVQVSGVVGGSEANKYLKIKSKADVKKIGIKELLPERITAAGFKEENLEKFVQVEGEVESKSETEVVLNDGIGEMSLRFKPSAKIDSKKIKAGQKITASGLLSEASGVLAIFPRGDFDLIVATSSVGVEAGIVLGAATSSSEWILPARKNNSNFIPYILIAGGGILLIFGVYLVRKYPFKK